MKKKTIIITLALLLVLIVGCYAEATSKNGTEHYHNMIDTTYHTANNENDFTSFDAATVLDYGGGDRNESKFRPRFHNLPKHFVDLVGTRAFFNWLDSRSWHEMQNEHVVIGFIRHFNISKDDFIRASEKALQFLKEIEEYPIQSTSFELMPVDLIFSFDNERINRYFLWENSPIARDFGIGMDIGRHRPLFYNMPAPFAELVGREVFIEWRHARSQEVRENESIAVSFVRYFGISRYEFERANEEMRQIWEAAGVSAADSSIHELYLVDLIFTFDNELINEFFLWENSSIPAERRLGQTAR